MHRARMLLVLCASLAACKGKQAPRPDPAVARDLADCRKALEDKSSYTATLEKQLAELQLRGPGSVLVTIQGEAMKISGRGPSEQAGRPKGSADDAALYEAFLKALERSRGAIQKCYQSALKNNTTLQSKTLTLNIEVNYATSGGVSGSRFQPRVSAGFDQCMEAVAKRWTLPAMPSGVTFAYRQTLTPE